MGGLFKGGLGGGGGARRATFVSTIPTLTLDLATFARGTHSRGRFFGILQPPYG